MKKAARLGFGIANLLVSALVAWGVFRGLPTRWWLVDGGAVIVVALLGSSGAALVSDHRLKETLTRLASAVSLVIGLALFATLAITASWLSGVYGPIGRGGAAVFMLVAALVLPYLVVLPAVELAWVGPRARASGSPSSPRGGE
ncbi:MAG: hypothetical protein JST00_42420 [Deltaproteobacteria bacterium]|nr:hypothetical protein [Deltaproteobacteria bacterium]